MSAVYISHGMISGLESPRSSSPSGLRKLFFRFTLYFTSYISPLPDNASKSLQSPFDFFVFALEASMCLKDKKPVPHNCNIGHRSPRATCVSRDLLLLLLLLETKRQSERETCSTRALCFPRQRYNEIETRKGQKDKEPERDGARIKQRRRTSPAGGRVDPVAVCKRFQLANTL